MIFDQLCHHIERQPLLPQLLGMDRRDMLFHFVKSARLFLIDKAVENLPINWDEAVVDEENFFLPFPIVAIEDPDSCVLLIDTLKEQTGLIKPRMVIMCSSGGRHIEEDFFSRHGRAPTSNEILRVKQFCYIAAGMIYNGSFGGVEEGWGFKVGLMGGVWMDGDEIAGTSKTLGYMYPNMDKEGLTLDLGTHAKSAIEEIIWFNQPHRFVMEASSLKTKTPKPGRLPRSHERPTYTLIRPNDARRIMRLPSLHQGGTVAPHERRRHFRTLRSEVFTNKRGQTIQVRATWVGPDEAIVGNKKYKIMTDI